ncbi:lipocalin-like domain-containing protein [Streptomyces bluensis]|uniref:Lipocalin-like domain-containing protein n=1 Tax=Streptomyces bluensis TaxID=33897 RepID=A0ABW6UTA2_9ACTN
MTTSHPTLISAADDLAATAPGKNDSWWFASRLHDGDGNVFWAKIHAMEAEGACHGTVALLREADGHTSNKHTVEPLHDVKPPTDRLDVQTSVLNLSGDLDELKISGTTDTASIRLALRREEPVLFSGGSGLFPFFGGTTGQFALPGLIASGTITVEGVTHRLTGRTWCDRQWLSETSEPLRFLWLGLDLGAGRYLSVWDTEGAHRVAGGRLALGHPRSANRARRSLDPDDPRTRRTTGDQAAQTGRHSRRQLPRVFGDRDRRRPRDHRARLRRCVGH